MNDQDQPLEAREILLHHEGSQMLQAVAAKQQPAPSGIVLADGSPATPTQPPATPVQAPIKQEDLRAKAHAIRNAEKLKNITAMSKAVEGSEKLQDVQQVVFACYQLLYWARMETASHEDVIDSMVMDYEHHIERAIYDDPKGYNFEMVVKQFRHGAMKILDKFLHQYRDQGRARAQQLKRIKEILGEGGIALPGKTFQEVLGKPFVPGMLMVLAGKPEDTALLTQRLFDESNERHAFKPHVYSLQEGLHPPMPAHFHQLNEWKNAAAKMSVLNATMASVLEEDCPLVIIEDLESLYVVDERGFHATERKDYALNRLYQWAINNLVAVVVCDNIKEDVYDARFYGHLPSFKVTSRATAAGPEVLVNSTPLPPFRENEE